MKKPPKVKKPMKAAETYAARAEKIAVNVEKTNLKRESCTGLPIMSS